MTAAMNPDEGSLPQAKLRLSRAVWALIDPQRQMFDGEMRSAPSLYLQLRDSVPGAQGSGHGTARSLPPCWLDAIDLLSEIDTALEIWQPQADGVPVTVGRLRVLEAKGWRPQDTRQVEQIAANLEAWALEIVALLDPPAKKTLPNPCPACNTATVYRRDSGGELVRQPALQFGPQGCYCVKCRAVWAPNRFLFLAKVLGYEMPAGVLE